MTLEFCRSCRKRIRWWYDRYGGHYIHVTPGAYDHPAKLLRSELDHIIAHGRYNDDTCRIEGCTEGLPDGAA